MVKSSLRSVLRRVPVVKHTVRTARFGDLRRTGPLTSWGEERGLPIDRWYIESYLSDHAHHLRGHVLEVKGDHYASRFGAAAVDVVDIDASNADANVVGDLCEASTLEPDRYDAAIVTQTLHMVSDPSAAAGHLYRSLKGGGTLLITVPCLSRICGPGDRWRWTPEGFEQILTAALPPQADIQVHALGNGLAGRAFLFGLAVEDLKPNALAVQDPDYPFVVGARVRRER